jgi:hypothetical protein
VHVTDVEPNGNGEPEAGAQVTDGLGSTESVAIGVAYETTAPEALVASAVRSDSAGSAGAVVSLTNTANDVVPVLPDPSVALHVTIVVPSWNNEPEAGEQPTLLIGPETESVAVGFVNVTEAPEELVASAVMSDTAEKIGFVVSATVTEAVTGEDCRPWLSVALHVTVVVVGEPPLYGKVNVTCVEPGPANGPGGAATAPVHVVVVVSPVSRSEAETENVSGVPAELWACTSVKSTPLGGLNDTVGG